MSLFKKAPKKKGLFGTYASKIRKDHTEALAALGVVSQDETGKMSACALPSWWWLNDLCDDRNVDLGDVLEHFGHAMTCFVADLSKTKEGSKALAALRSYWVKEGKKFNKTLAEERALSEALEREFSKPKKTKQRAARRAA